MKEERVLILVPARGSSKRIKNKNIKFLGNKPLIDWTLKRCIDSGLGDIYVSTEDKDIMNVVYSYSIRTDKYINIIPRPEQLSMDTTRVYEVAKHILEIYGDSYTTLFMTLPTTPFITTGQMQQAYQQFLKNRIPLFCLTEVEKSSTLLLSKNEMDRVYEWGENNIQKVINGDYGKACIDNGGMLICSVDKFLEQPDYYSWFVKQGYVVSPERGLDIDTPLDFALAETILRQKMVFI